MGWRERLQREYLEADRAFVEGVLPVGTVDAASFGLIADATRYVLVAEGEEVHIRADVASLEEILTSLARGGSLVSRGDAEKAVGKFASLWEEKARARGKWAEVVEAARASGEILVTPPRQSRRSFWQRLFGR